MVIRTKTPDPPGGPSNLLNGTDPGSFRDRTARVFYADGNVYRGLTSEALDAWRQASACSFFTRGMATGSIVETSLEPPPRLPVLSSSDPEWRGVLRHRRIPFVSYPYEWPFGMLKAAALLHLALLRAALDEGVTMKDGTPFNVQWMGANPVFIDTATFVPWQRGQPWLGYRQFCRSFLFPLMLQAYKGVSFQPWIRGRLEGMLAEELRRLLTWRDLVRPGVLTHVVTQSRLEQRFGGTSRDIRTELSQAGLDQRVLASMIERLQRLVDGMTWTIGKSVWSDYATRNSYDSIAMAAKEAFVLNAIRSRQRHLVWDLGCNTGHFATLAAAHAEYVVAIDSDHESVEQLYRELSGRRESNVLTLTMDLSDPSPAMGWCGRERRALPQRGTPDLVLCLALVHHLAIGANLPIADILDWLFEWCGGDLVIEFATQEDEMVKRLLLNRDQRYDDYDLLSFEGALASRFTIADRLQLSSGTRYLYYATRRAGAQPKPFDGQQEVM